MNSRKDFAHTVRKKVVREWDSTWQNQRESWRRWIITCKRILCIRSVVSDHRIVKIIIPKTFHQSSSS